MGVRLILTRAVYQSLVDSTGKIRPINIGLTFFGVWLFIEYFGVKVYTLYILNGIMHTLILQNLSPTLSTFSCESELRVLLELLYQTSPKIITRLLCSDDLFDFTDAKKGEEISSHHFEFLGVLLRIVYDCTSNDGHLVIFLRVTKPQSLSYSLGMTSICNPGITVVWRILVEEYEGVPMLLTYEAFIAEFPLFFGISFEIAVRPHLLIKDELRMVDFSSQCTLVDWVFVFSSNSLACLKVVDAPIGLNLLILFWLDYKIRVVFDVYAIGILLNISLRQMLPIRIINIH